MGTLHGYKYLIFDVDDTLLNFYSAFKNAQKDIARKLGIEDSAEYRRIDEECGWKAWVESGLDNTESKEVQDNYHIYYHQYLKNHYMFLLQALEIQMDTDELVNCYVESILSSKELMEPDTLSVYIELSKQYELVLATNGIEIIQRERVSDFMPYTHKVYISERMGCIKPSKSFFEFMMWDLDCKVSECLMIGDSLTNDIIGAKEMGMAVCYYNIRKKARPENVVIDYEVNSITELEQILL